MKSRWDESVAQTLNGDLLKLRVYSSRLLGQESDLVLHGGGNTSVKATVKNFFGDDEAVLYVKGSGWDLSTIAAPGFAPVRLEVLQRLAALEQLTDSEMVTQQRAAMLDPNAPNPSVEAILHAIIPYAFVDHTHADAVVTLTNTPTGAEQIGQVYGDSVLLIPYVMPGFILARKIRALTQGIDWSQYKGMVLMNHGIFTFADDAHTAYETMIELVSLAEASLAQHNAVSFATAAPQADWLTLAKIRQQVSRVKGAPMLAQLDQRPEAVGFSNLPNVAAIATRGPITPDHVIRTKAIPVVVDRDPEAAVNAFAENYRQYFERHTDGQLTQLDAAPRWAVWPGYGTLSFDRSIKATAIITDIIEHTRRAIQIGEALGGWQALGEKDLFEMEYWELEQAKLGKAKAASEFQGKIALVTGAASGIGKACAETLHQQGTAVVGFDVNPDVAEILNKPGLVGVQGDVTDEAAVKGAIAAAIQHFGGLDIVVSNAGIFPLGQTLENLDADIWEKSLAINLTSQRALLRHAIPFLRHGIDPTILFIASRNVLAPGPGAAAYSVAKAGLTQLARIAALELAPEIRVNVLHPDCVYDTGIWTPAVLAGRAERYGISVDDYKSRNLLKQPVSSREVAQLVCTMASRVFAKTTGAQVPIDGGSDRVI
ncbi:bifunctional aldolase/short-chain dehydrogenase [Nodosilinea sp. LEGE 07088]|uniref:bifunctional aldolase/short-chain dehydrogenase n=1 Tax=Nodosilinea sp. LEGE 07088 TaxID=2777968 RepID=UPI0018827AF1|nr:bifunctional aldolase/short-chain dehydrogenase [Nodosilinea sp. LEGE 07088]MBE9140479.1 bifunctional aldolase/short-chain dehydrogenase [Nodosilinea sp. LEGE 07088]